MRRSKKPLPMGFLGTVLLICVIERIVGSHWLDFGTPTAADWKQAGSAASRKATKADVLLFGDSMVKFGVIPSVLEARFQQPVHSLAVYNGTPQTSYFLLKRALERGAKPRAVVVDFQPELLMADHIRLHPRQWPELLTPGDCLELANEAAEPEFVASTLLAKIAPSIKDRHEIRASIRGTLDGLYAWPRNSLLIYARNWRQNKGGQVLARNPLYAGEVPPTYALFFNDWSAKPLNAAFVRKFLKLAESKSIPVYWVLPPNVPPVQAKRADIGLTARYDRFVRLCLAKYPQLTVLDARSIGFGHDKFVDAVHLDRQGASELSEAIAEAIEGSRESRWVDLKPAHASRSRAFPLEDVEETRVALMKTGVIR